MDEFIDKLGAHLGRRRFLVRLGEGALALASGLGLATLAAAPAEAHTCASGRRHVGCCCLRYASNCSSNQWRYCSNKWSWGCCGHCADCFCGECNSDKCSYSVCTGCSPCCGSQATGFLARSVDDVLC